jgi:alginate O-acetyltransferase complex protein AlgI
MPLGISFWTFQGHQLSRATCIARKELDPTVLEAFPVHGVLADGASGPVCRLTEMLPTVFSEMRRPTWDGLAAGTPRIVLGLFMKLVPAQVLARLVIAAGEGINAGFDQVAGGWGGADVWLLGFAYGFFLFFDFAGYSHIVIGSARLFGLELRENFDRPYLSTTPSIFWTRWHMSLSSWIRDYVFMPMAPMCREQWWRLFVLAFSMVLFGLWHNATLPFLIWGAYHGILLVLHRQVQSAKRALDIDPPAWLETPIAWFLTISLMCLGWVLFRAHDVHQIGEMLGAVFNPMSYSRLVLRVNFYIVTVVIIAAYFTGELLRVGVEKLRERPWGERVTWLISPAYYAGVDPAGRRVEQTGDGVCLLRVLSPPLATPATTRCSPPSPPRRPTEPSPRCGATSRKRLSRLGSLSTKPALRPRPSAHTGSRRATPSSSSCRRAST